MWTECNRKILSSVFDSTRSLLQYRRDGDVSSYTNACRLYLFFWSISVEWVESYLFYLVTSEEQQRTQNELEPFLTADGNVFIENSLWIDQVGFRRIHY